MGVDGMFFSKVMMMSGRYFKCGKAPISIDRAERIRAACEEIQKALEEAREEHGQSIRQGEQA